MNLEVVPPEITEKLLSVCFCVCTCLYLSETAYENFQHTKKAGCVMTLRFPPLASGSQLKASLVSV